MILKLATYFFYVQNYKRICRHAIVEDEKMGTCEKFMKKFYKDYLQDIIYPIPTH